MVQDLEIETAAGADLVLVQHVEHAPEADAIAVVHARIVRDIGLGRPALRQVLEELHIRRDPERHAGVAGPSDDGAFRDRGIREPAGWQRHGSSPFPCEGCACVRTSKPTRLPRLRLEPVDDLAAGRLPHPGVGGDVAEHFVEMPDAPRLAHDPRVQVQHHHPSGGRAVGVQTVEPLAPQQVDLVDGAPPVQVDVVVVEVRIDPERIELAGLRRHLVGLLVVAPVADVADAFRGEQVGGVRRLLEVWAGPADRARAGGLFDRRDRVADILPLLVLGHADVDDAPAREAVRDELRVAPLPLLDQERVVVGDGLVERQGRRDAVLVQDGEDAKDADAIAVLVVAVAADIGKMPAGSRSTAPRGRPTG